MAKTLVPVYREILGDLDTPVSVYLKLNQPNSFLLESVTGGENVARYSFIGLDPFCIYKHDWTSSKANFDGKVETFDLGAIDSLEALVNRFTIKSEPKLPRFIGGAVGFFSWEIVKEIEKLPKGNKGKCPFPLAHYLFPRSMVIFDHAQRNLILMTLADSKRSPEALERLDHIESLLRRPLDMAPMKVESMSKDDVFNFVSSNISKSEFIKQVKQVKSHIYEGDIFQLVLSQRFKVTGKKPPFDVYRVLRSINPSPYMYYFNFRDYQVIGTSPEILVRLEDNEATVRPIAGTRPRIADQEEALIESLVNDEKEKAEHLMLLDLGRNDLGRVCKFGSVKTDKIMEIEAYSHVLHMVSNVVGKLKKGMNAFDLLRATFPAGTVSGAPKVRAMEIIDEIEKEKRGPYAGALGYFDFRGNMDLCIIIRTILAKADNFYVQAGAGLVADSVPEKEYEETQNKARGMIQACLSLGDQA